MENEHCQGVKLSRFSKWSDSLDPLGFVPPSVDHKCKRGNLHILGLSLSVIMTVSLFF